MKDTILCVYHSFGNCHFYAIKIHVLFTKFNHLSNSLFFPFIDLFPDRMRQLTKNLQESKRIYFFYNK